MIVNIVIMSSSSQLALYNVAHKENAFMGWISGMNIDKLYVDKSSQE